MIPRPSIILYVENTRSGVTWKVMFTEQSTSFAASYRLAPDAFASRRAGEGLG